MDCPKALTLVLLGGFWFFQGKVATGKGKDITHVLERLTFLELAQMY